MQRPEHARMPPSMSGYPGFGACPQPKGDDTMPSSERCLGRGDEQHASASSSTGTRSASIDEASPQKRDSQTSLPRRGPSTRLDVADNAFGQITFAHKATLRENKGADTDIAKRYRIDEREFGSGGNGKVFIGQDRQFDDRRVAIKKVTLNIFDAEKKSATIRKEMDIMKELDHPNICKLFETYEETHEQKRVMYFVMELCEGGELFDRIADDGNVTEVVAANIINQVCGALNYAHGKRIAHRDLKPENVCLVSRCPTNHHVKVIDWGLGFFFGGMARMKSAVGSLAYAAPEVIEAEETSSYTEACDLWSLGAMSYVMLCGRPPFWGSVAGQLSKMHAETYPMTAAPWPSVSTEAKDFIRCLLRADPRNRLPIASAIDHAWLRNFRESQTVSKEAVSSVLWNMEKSSNNSKFLSVCLASAARQMDVKNFEGIREVFQNLDANHDGTLDMEELRNGMAKIYGMDSEQAQNVAAMFTRLDLDENGMVDYTEFMAAALSDKMLEQEHILWTAFKSFDVHGDDGKITKEDIKEVLSKANVREAWTPEVCDQVAAEVLRMFDQDGRGYLDFEAWLRMMRTVAWPSDEDESPRMPSRTFSASSSSEATRSAVSWISLDPRTGQILAYPSEIAKTIEAHWQMKRSSVELGSMFHNARIVFSGNKDGHPFQRTPNGLRDVRRIEVLPEMVEIEMFLTGSAGEFRFAADGAGRKQLTSGLAKNSIDPREALESYRKSRESTSMDTGASWSLTEFGVSLNDTMGTVGKFLWGSRQEESTRKKTSL